MNAPYNGWIVLYSTWPDRESAEKAARALVEADLAGCVTLLAQALSFYRWEGAIQADAEMVMLAKMTAAQAGPAKAEILAQHPYKLPCILALPVDETASHGPYLAWLGPEKNGP